ncbi:winged helix-turn-helix transcriptional regulator [Brevibacterium casei]|uniref:ArsR/SmtB family transcription factor n=1 Tax=Brevibacterium casei TaxID=33889 RepID=UPI00186BA954|nr:winged helix-turn-helix domain-containing protein [Brevibacterium casei]MBE4695351.1 winged helix-turn-helix transcriptional regulator [Brevibacterium casei]MBY3578473.1 winged helix-turn-helix transcriptional regulator [Brevibacterium casei]
MNAEQSEPGATADPPAHPARDRDDPTARVAHAIERRDATDAEAKALASSVRIRILRLCLDEELSNREIAEALDLNPATALHHVRMLVDTGFLEAQEPRRGRRGAREIPYRATGKSWFIDAGDITDPMIEAFAAEFSAAPYRERSMSRMAAMLTPAEVVEFQQRLEDLLEDFRSRRSQDDARQWALFVAMHPSAAPDEGAS